MIIRGLLNSQFANQVRVSREYAQNCAYFERIVNMIKELKLKREKFQEWKKKLLMQWQYKVFERIMNQNGRTILWVVDRQGNAGKTFLGTFLCFMYNFKYLNGVINTRDLVSLIDEKIDGVVLDVCRSSINNFDYAALETLKLSLIHI